MNIKLYCLLGLLSTIIGCTDTAQMGNIHYAMEMLGKCNFVEAIDASNDALRLGKENEKAYIASIAIQAKSYEALGQLIEANKSYLLLIEHGSNIKSIEQAKAVVSKLNPLIIDCA